SRATPARGTPEEVTAGSNAKFPEEKAPEDKDKVGRARLKNIHITIKTILSLHQVAAVDSTSNL
ncbi:MAG: hypothetical protein WA137_11745, partial [Methanothrix sp.]